MIEHLFDNSTSRVSCRQILIDLWPSVISALACRRAAPTHRQSFLRDPFVAPGVDSCPLALRDADFKGADFDRDARGELTRNRARWIGRVDDIKGYVPIHVAADSSPNETHSIYVPFQARR